MSTNQLTQLSGAAILATATGASASNLVTANVNGKVTTVNVLRGDTVASGDVILVVKVGSQWWAMGRTFGAAPTPPVNDTAPDPQPTTITGTLVLNAVETRSWRGSWRTDNDSVYQGNFGTFGNNTGCAFYGSGPRSLAGATVTSATIHVRRVAAGAFAAQTSTMRLMTEATRPSGAPTLTSSTTGPSLAVDATVYGFTIPTAWAQSMVDGTAGGIAFFVGGGSPYIRFAGRGDWNPAFTLIINWQRG